MHAKLAERVGRWGREVSYEVEFYQPDIRNGVVTCAALSLDGRHVALGFGSGVIEVVDIDHQRTICQLQHNSANLPDWIEFVHGSHRVATEDIDGNVAILGHGIAPVKLGNLPSGLYPTGTAISDNGLFIIRAPRNFNNPWCDNMTLISVSEHPFIQALTSPSCQGLVRGRGGPGIASGTESLAGGGSGVRTDRPDVGQWSLAT
ncbi:uncharacterized protein EI90DRAFT_423019 [Cantharellus anzutake]|uniref:uncharacterized protein n=1 Tax=Cantharellus anzutake TaxID=1750568 RepID=UPI0019044EC5|nr:uncharacterized protein EI90DRAFT_423019 [Cantharellus anzutake]KAF8314630.1 hypothetical protein EI90DRAFT_423019 [Cantharellus anzutake]